MLSTVRNIKDLNTILLNKINQLLDGNIKDFFNDNSNEYELALAISYFTTSKDYFIEKVNTKVTSVIDEEEIKKELLKDNGPTIYEPSNLSAYEIIDRIRNSLLHSRFELDNDAEKIYIRNIDDDTDEVKLIATIPYSWIKNYCYNGLTEKFNSTSFNFKLPIYSEYIHTKNDVDSYVNNTMICNIELKSDKPFSNIEIREKIRKLTNYTRKMDRSIIKTIESELDIELLDYSKYLELAINALQENSEHNSKIPLSFYFSMEMIKQVVKQEYDIDLSYSFSEMSKDNFYRHTNLDKNKEIEYHSYMELMRIYLEPEINTFRMIRLLQNYNYYNKYLNNSDMYKKNKDFFERVINSNKENSQELVFEALENPDIRTDEFYKVYDICQSLNNNFNSCKGFILKTLLFVYGQNIYSLNKEYFDRMDDSMIDIFDIEGYTSKRLDATDYNLYQYHITTTKKNIERHEYNIKSFKQKLKKIPEYKHEARNKVIKMISDITDSLQADRKKLEKYEEELNDFLNRHKNEIIYIDGKTLMKEDSKREMLRIIRNCFSHPGRIGNIDLKNMTITLEDYNDSNNISAIITCKIDSLIKFLSQEVFKTNFKDETKDEIKKETKEEIKGENNKKIVATKEKVKDSKLKK